MKIICYLCERMQSLLVGRIPLEETCVRPLLFLIYLNYLLTLHNIGDILSLADDTLVFIKIAGQNLKNAIETDFGNILNWFNHKFLTINYEKTKFIPFVR